MSVARKLWYILSAEQRRSAIFLLCLMFVGMLLETLSIGLVIPALSLMASADLRTNYPILLPLLKAIGNPDRGRLIVIGMVALAGVYTLKVIFVGFLAWRQARFVYNLQADFSRRLFAGYLYQPYSFHLQRNSAQLIRNTIGQVSEISKVIQQGLMLTAEVLVITGIAVLLLSVEPFGALLVVGIVGVASLGFNLLTRGYILRWGKARQTHEGFRIQFMQEGLGGVKDAKLLGREQNFLRQYETHNIGSAHAAQRQATLEAFPRLWLELLAVSGLAVLVIVMLARGKPLEGIVPTLGLFAAAAFRFMPSVNRVLTAVHAVRFYLPAIDTMYSECRLLEGHAIPQRTVGLPFTRALSLENVSFQYPGAERPSLSNATLTIPRGAAVGFVGSTGAGKSTLVDTLLGLLTPGSGCVKVDGVDIQSNLRGWQDHIGYVPQSIFLTDDTLRRNVAFGLPDDQIDDQAVRRALRAAQLEEFVETLPQGVATFVGERGIRLSGGQRQRIGIARALYHDPSVLVLDEATSSLDTNTEQGVMDAVGALHGEKTIIIVAHRLSTVEHCDILFRLDHGRVVEEGSAAMVLGTS